MKRQNNTVLSYFSAIPNKKSCIGHNAQLENTQAKDANDLINETERNNCNIIQNVPLSSISDEIIQAPNHPKDAQLLLPIQKLNKKQLVFHSKWFEDHKWLHVAPDISGIVCYYCYIYVQNCTDKTLIKRCEPAFTTDGFKNWKKVLEKFRNHEKCDSHKQAVLSFRQITCSIEKQLSDSKTAEQDLAYHCLLKIFSTIKFLARQGIALRGSSEDNGNFRKCLDRRAEDSPELRQWLQRRSDWSSHDIQNEILELMANHMLRKMLKTIKREDKFFFSVIADGTRDISGKEQIRICIRYVDKNLMPNEIFVGLYEAAATTVEYLAKIIFDCLLRMELPLQNLRGQSYDGASNMSGKNMGVQSRIIERQPLATFIHCGTHSANLVLTDDCDASVVVRNSMSWAHDLGVLFSQSLTAKQELKTIFEKYAPVINVSSIKPLCHTRWICRGPQIVSILNNYEEILESLENLSFQKNIHAGRLLQKFESGTTVLGLLIAKNIFRKLEKLIKILQGKQITIVGMMESVKIIKDSIASSRTDEEFENILHETEDYVKKHDLSPIEIPRSRKPPRKISGNSEIFSTKDVSEYYRKEYFIVIDFVLNGLNCRFNQTGITRVVNLENCLLKGEIPEIIRDYPEIDTDQLEGELKIFLKKYAPNTLLNVSTTLQNSFMEVREIFRNIEMLLRLILVIPSSTCQSKRSFSSLRRLKSYLRSTMSQPRLNHVALLHAHQKEVDSLNIANHEL